MMRAGNALEVSDECAVEVEHVDEQYDDGGALRAIEQTCAKKLTEMFCRQRVHIAAAVTVMLQLVTAHATSRR